ncbi:MAG: N-acetyltransferase [Pseudomonadota bacterium]
MLPALTNPQKNSKGIQMNFGTLGKDRQDDLTNLFRSTFSVSEGDDEGKLIGDLASKLANAIDEVNVICFGALQNQYLTGAIFFTRLIFMDDAPVYMLAPVAVSTPHQGAGIGKSLIKFALNAITGKGAEVVVTYGDPAFYGRLGFEPLSESVLKAPMKLSMPAGWLGQSLTGRPIQARQERPGCVDAFRNPAYW